MRKKKRNFISRRIKFFYEHKFISEENQGKWRPHRIFKLSLRKYMLSISKGDIRIYELHSVLKCTLNAFENAWSKTQST